MILTLVGGRGAVGVEPPVQDVANGSTSTGPLVSLLMIADSEELSQQFPSALVSVVVAFFRSAGPLPLRMLPPVLEMVAPLMSNEPPPRSARPLSKIQTAASGLLVNVFPATDARALP